MHVTLLLTFLVSSVLAAPSLVEERATAATCDVKNPMCVDIINESACFNEVGSNKAGILKCVDPGVGSESNATSTQKVSSDPSPSEKSEEGVMKRARLADGYSARSVRVWDASGHPCLHISSLRRSVHKALSFD